MLYVYNVSLSVIPDACCMWLLAKCLK